MSSSGKLRPDHLQRQAYIYIRQSTLQQVYHHTESGRRQYALEHKAIALGWPSSAVVILDEDQGRSGQSLERPGFQRLMEAVARGEVGAVLCLEISRLARRSSVWHALIELCAWHDTLLIDEEGLYDPNLANDRLLLGVRGLVDENELATLRRRMQVSREDKARRGELKVQPPTGFVLNPLGKLCLDPDEQVQGAFRLFFDQFRRWGTASAVVRYFAAQRLGFPTRQVGGAHDGEVAWKPLTYGRALYVLHDPIYAGAYTYGRHAHSRQRKPREKQHQSEVRLPQDEWLVLQWDAFPGYLSRADYEANQQRLQENRASSATSGAARAGSALLSGRVLCGHCGRPMRVQYTGTDGQYYCYVCFPGQHQADFHLCQRVPGAGVDASVVQTVLTHLTPVELDLSLRILEDVAQQQAAVRQQWERRVERARYEADLAQRRYRQVDPENRLVARTLEHEWEERLGTLTDAEQAFARAQHEAPLWLDDTERARLLELAHDLPTVWRAETTPVSERKELLRLLIADVTVTRQTAEILVQLRWVTNQVDTWTVPLPQQGARTSPVVLDRIRKLASTHTDAEIAACLNAEGWTTAHSESFTAQRVLGLRREHRIVKVQCS
jgi:DNA invertase Pin-like site-specific DNA recombinase